MNNTKNTIPTFLNFFRIHRLLSYVVLAMVLPSIAFPAGSLPDGREYGAPKSPVTSPMISSGIGLELPGWQPNPLSTAGAGAPVTGGGKKPLSSEAPKTSSVTTPIRIQGSTAVHQGSRFNVINPIRALGPTVRGVLPAPSEIDNLGSSTDSQGSTPPKAQEDETWDGVEHVTVSMNPMRGLDSNTEQTLDKSIGIRAKFPLVLKAIALEASKNGNPDLGRRLKLAAATLAAKMKAEGEDQKRKDAELRALEDIPMTPGLQKVSAFMEEVFSQKVTRMRTIANWATVLVVGGLCYSLRGIIGYFNDNITAVPNSSISQYFQNEGADVASKIVRAIGIDLMLIIPYYVYRMKVLVDHVASQLSMAPIGSKMKAGSKNDVLLAMGLGITYLVTMGLSVLQGLGPANDTYQANAPFSNTAEYAQNAPVPLGIFMALNYFLVLIKPVEEKIISRMVNKYSGPEVAKKRTEMLEDLAQAKKKVHGMHGHALRNLWARLQPEQVQPERASQLSGIQSLRALFQIVDKKDHTPQTSPLLRVVSEARAKILAKVSRRQVQAPISHRTESQHVSSQKDFKPILKSMGIGLFWLVAMAVSVASAFLSFNKGTTGILNVDQRIKTGKPDLSFYEQIQIGRAQRAMEMEIGLALNFESQTLASIPGLWNTSMAGWDVYNGLSNYTGDFSANDWAPYTQPYVNATDACSYCFSRGSYSINSDYMGNDDPNGNIVTFPPDCPWVITIPGINAFNNYGFNIYTQLFYNEANCYGIANYIQSLYMDIPYSLGPIPNHVLPQSRYFYEWYLSGMTPVPINPNSTAPYTPTPAMEGFAETMGGVNAAASFAVGVFFFNKFFQYLYDSFSKEPTNPMPGKNNRIFNAIEMPLAGAQALFWSADSFFLAWGVLNDASLGVKILVGGAAVATRFTVWFRTFDEAFVAMAGLIQQGWRNVGGRYQKWRNPSYKRPPLPENVIKDRLIRKVDRVMEAIRKMNPGILEEVHGAIRASNPQGPTATIV